MFSPEDSQTLGRALAQLPFPGARDAGIAIRREAAQVDSEISNLPPTILELLGLEAPLTASGGFNPGQARVPRGNPDGGEWVDSAGGLADLLGETLIGGPVTEAVADTVVKAWEAPRRWWEEATTPSEHPDPAPILGTPGEPEGYGEIAEDYYATEVNPGFDLYGGDTNCQRCSVAMEMRARGYDVVAPPATGSDGKAITMASLWRTKEGRMRMFPSRSEGLDEAVAAAAKAADPAGESAPVPGSRYILIASNVKGWAHAWNAEVNPDGTLSQYDGQSGIPIKDLSEWTDFAALRVDDLYPTAEIWADNNPYASNVRHPAWVIPTDEYTKRYHQGAVA